MNIIKLSKIDKNEKPDNYDEMKAWFEKRTNLHIKRVQKYCKKIEDYDSERFKGLCKQAEDHDQSKFEDPEMEPYIFTSWQYKCKDEGKKFEVSEKIKDEMNKATNHHVKNKRNKHHPEASLDIEVNVINREDRDKPPAEMIDATKMNDIDVAEMCADWFSMSEEKGTSTKTWADKNVNIRWKFNEEQVDTIYELIDEIKVDKGG